MIIYDYVRTRDGYIGNVNNSDDKNIFENHNSILGKNLLIGKIVKSSPNIIDLIEVGDYVNGNKITSIRPADICGDEELDYQHIYYGRLEEIYKEDIKSIVTKEQFKSMEYNVGEDNE